MSSHVALAILSICAFAGPLIAERVGAPGAVLELIIGLGLSFVIPRATVAPGTFLANLGSLGFLVLMFLVGVDIDVRDLRRESRLSLVAGVALFVLSLVISEVVLGKVAGTSALWVLSGAAVSVGLAAPVLNAHGWGTSKLSQEILVVGSVAEVAYLLTLSAVSVAQRHGFHTTAVLVSFRTIAVVLVALGSGFLIRRYRARLPQHFHRWFRRDDPIELGLRGALAMLFIFVAASSVIHMPSVIGALSAGVVFRAVIGNARAIIERLTSVANSFFIPLFFLNVGLETPFRSDVVELLPTVALALGVMMVSRLFLVPYFRARGFGMRVSFAGSFLLMAPLTLLVTTAKIGSSAGLLTQRSSTAIILIATVSAAIYPLIGRYLLGTLPPAPLDDALSE